MPNNEKTPIVVYHGDSCSDGFGSALAAWLVFSQAAEYLPASYADKTLADHVLARAAGRTVYILDFSFSVEVTLRLVEVAERVVVRDHHKSAVESWQNAGQLRYLAPRLAMSAKDGWLRIKAPKLDAVLCDHHSGAMLSWQLFHPGEDAPGLIQHVEDEDLWRFALPTTREYLHALRSHPQEFHLWQRFAQHAMGSPFYQVMVRDGAAILRTFQQQCASVLEACPPREIVLGTSKHTGLAVNTNALFSSEIGHHLAATSETFGLAWYVEGVSARVSLRSSREHGNLDVSALAAEFGGGGHRNAAGFRMPLAQFIPLLLGGSETLHGL